jgi:hypothetical protein
VFPKYVFVSGIPERKNYRQKLSSRKPIGTIKYTYLGYSQYSNNSECPYLVRQPVVGDTNATLTICKKLCQWHVINAKEPSVHRETEPEPEDTKPRENVLQTNADRG